MSDFVVDRSDITKSLLVTAAAYRVNDGQCLVKIEHFAFTSNNVSYAVTGDALRYWAFYPSPVDKHGRVPVWGFATVVASRCNGVRSGERIYGFLPMSHYTVLTPGRVNATGFSDVSPHRTALPAVYNAYRFTRSWSIYKPNDEQFIMLFQPLFATSYLIQDFLQGSKFFGASSVIISSASSKTSIALACLLRQQVVKVIGLTSEKNVGFVQDLKLYDSIVTYSTLPTSLPPATTQVVYVDMSGNRQVLASIHNHFKDNLKHSCSVGATHWDTSKQAGKLLGPKPVFFFAPGYIAERSNELSGAVLFDMVDKAWNTFTQYLYTTAWLTVDSKQGKQAISAAYVDVVNNKVPPSVGVVMSLWDDSNMNAKL